MIKKPGRPKGLPKTGGRKKNTPNKIKATFKTALLEAFHDLGGTEGLVRWAKKNRTEFYKLCARLIPHEVSGPGDDGPWRVPPGSRRGPERTRSSPRPNFRALTGQTMP
jgi:hypothetical protein